MNKHIKVTGSSRKDNALRKDVRLLGAILGDTIRDQEGKSLFDFG
jgi:phosphoenolpyruvate carboxylase